MESESDVTLLLEVDREFQVHLKPLRQGRDAFSVIFTITPSVNDSGQDSQPLQPTDPKASLAFENDS